MALLSVAVLRQAEERLAAMVGPVELRVPVGNAAMRLLTEELAGVAPREGEEALLTVTDGEGESLTLADGWGRATGMHFWDPPLGQELGALLDAVLAVSRGGAVLSPLGRSQAEALPEGSELWVLVTPT